MYSGSELTGSVVVVTGGSSGIGRAVAIAAARAGADIALTYRENEAGARETGDRIRALGRQSLELPLDLSDVRSIATVGPAVRKAFGRIDVWVNNAGADILTGVAASLSPIEKLDILLSVDVRGTMAASWHAVEMFQQQDDGGAIINMSWDHVLTGMAGSDPQLFAAAKGAVLAFSKSLARTVAPLIRVNILAPGWIETSFGATLDAARHEAIAISTPLKRWGTPEDVADAAVFLSSPAARFLTGQTIVVGGGIVM